MKNRKDKLKVFILIIIIFILLAIVAIMNMRMVINSTNINRVLERASANDAKVSDVLENYTFTSDTAGKGKQGTIQDYRAERKVVSLPAGDDTTVTLDVDDGYYREIDIDVTDYYKYAYNLGHDRFVNNAIDLGYQFATGYSNSEEAVLFDSFDSAWPHIVIIERALNSNNTSTILGKTDNLVNINIEVISGDMEFKEVGKGLYLVDVKTTGQFKVTMPAVGSDNKLAYCYITKIRI